MEGLNLRLANELGGLRRTDFYSSKISEFNIDKDPGSQWDAMLRYHFKIDSSALSDSDYFKLCAQLEWVIKMENKKYENN